MVKWWNIKWTMISWTSIQDQRDFECNRVADCSIQPNHLLSPIAAWWYRVVPNPIAFLNLHESVHWSGFSRLLSCCLHSEIMRAQHMSECWIRSPNSSRPSATFFMETLTEVYCTRNCPSFWQHKPGRKSRILFVNRSVYNATKFTNWMRHIFLFLTHDLVLS